MIKRSHIRQFLAVVDTGSFTRAAQHIRVTQPALSIGVADLEQAVGTKLFVRDRRRVRLTEAGGRFLSIARSLEKDFRAADNFGRLETGARPKLKVGTIRSVPSELLQSIAELLSRDFELELVENSDSELRSAVRARSLDAAIVSLRNEEPASHVVSLYREPIVLFVGASHALATQTEVAPEVLASETMIARRSCEFLAETSKFFVRHRVRARFALRSDNDERCLRMVAAGIGITTAPASFVVDGIVPIRVKGYEFQRELGVIANGDWASHGVIGQQISDALSGIRLLGSEWQEKKLSNSIPDWARSD